MAPVQNSRSFTLYIGIALAAVILINLISRNGFVRIDLTDNQIYSLSPSSKSILGQMDDLLTAKVYFTQNLPGQYGNNRRYLQDILEEYVAYSGGNLHFEFYRPGEDRQLGQEAQKYGIQPVQLQVIENDKLEVKRVYMGMVLLYGDRREILPVIQTTTGLEYEITTKIKKLVDDRRRTVGIASISDQTVQAETITTLLRETYNVRTLPLAQEVPPDVELLLINGVTDSLSEEEINALKAYIERGGNLFLAQSRIQADLAAQRGASIASNIFDILDLYGLQLEENLVLDRACGNVTVSQSHGFLRFNTAVEYPFFPRIREFSDHIIVGGLEQVHLLFSSEITFEDPNGLHIQPLFTTSEQSFTMTGFYNLNPLQNPAFQSLSDPGKVVGVYATARSDTTAGASQMVLVSDSSFLLDGGGGRMPENGVFVLNAADVLIGDRDLVALRSREVTERPLQGVEEGAKARWKWMNILLPPLLVIGFGLFQWRIEKNRARILEERYG